MIDLILCSRPPFCCYAKEKGMIIGARTDHKQQLSCCKPEFLDFNFHKPNWELHLSVVKKYKPKYAVAPDIFKEEDIKEVLIKAKKLSVYASSVIVVPHISGIINKIPEEFIIGYSVPTSYGGAEIGLWELAGRKVHLLGGTPRQQYEIWQYIQNVVSIDGNSYLKAAQYGEFINEKLKWDRSLKYKKVDMSILVKKSIDNIVKFWQRVS